MSTPTTGEVPVMTQRQKHLIYGEWQYYCKKVPGYVKKYSDRGMRDKNRKIFKKLPRASGKELRTLRDSLIENNLPLARMVAERFATRRNIPKDTVEDLYQDCCLALTDHVNSIIQKKKYDVRPFQSGIFYRMYYSLLNKSKSETDITRRFPVIQFDDETYNTNDLKELPNREYLDEIIGICLAERPARMLRYLYLPENENERMDLEQVAIRHGLTRERTRQIVVKAKRILRVAFIYNLKLTMEDLYEQII